MAPICAINFGRCQVVGKGAAVIIRNQRPSSGLNGLIQEPSLKQDKNAHLGSLVGPEPLLNKAVCQRCLEGPCKAISLPGEHLFQASRIAPNRMRPIIFHAFGKAKLDAPAQLARLARQGWETLPIALLGTPHYPAAWSLETWRPIGGCCFTGGASALTGNSAFRFCLLMQWHAITVPATALFHDARKEEDTDIESARTVSEPDQDFLERSLLAAATDQNSREPGSSLPEGLMAEKQVGLKNSRRPINPQLATPALFVPWQEIATQLDIPVEHEALREDLRTMFQTAIGILHTEHQRDFHQLQCIAFSRIPQGRVPVETVASTVLDSMYETHPWVTYWQSMLWHMAQSYRFWLAAPESPPPRSTECSLSFEFMAPFHPRV